VRDAVLRLPRGHQAADRRHVLAGGPAIAEPAPAGSGDRRQVELAR
jgi:hypothetical protein